MFYLQNGTAISAISYFPQGQHIDGSPPGKDESDSGEETDDYEDKRSKSDDTVTNDTQYNSVPNTRSNMTISLEGLQPPIDHSKTYSRMYNATKLQQYTNGQTNVFNYNSAPPTAHAHCPTCGKAISDPLMLYNTVEPENASVGSSPNVVPMGPLAAAAFESGMSAVEELRLLKAQVQDVARVCNAVARGDLSQKITVPVQGVVMVQLKDVINTMVRALVSRPSLIFGVCSVFP
jgi:osomolarity two-component system sensor histidine kinase NIK1